MGILSRKVPINSGNKESVLRGSYDSGNGLNSSYNQNNYDSLTSHAQKVCGHDSFDGQEKDTIETIRQMEEKYQSDLSVMLDSPPNIKKTKCVVPKVKLSKVQQSSSKLLIQDCSSRSVIIDKPLLSNRKRKPGQNKNNLEESKLQNESKISNGEKLSLNRPQPDMVNIGDDSFETPNIRYFKNERLRYQSDRYEITKDQSEVQFQDECGFKEQASNADERETGIPQPALYDQYYVHKSAIPNSFHCGISPDKEKRRIDKSNKNSMIINTPSIRRGISGWKLCQNPLKYINVNNQSLDRKASKYKYFKAKGKYKNKSKDYQRSYKNMISDTIQDYVKSQNRLHRIPNISDKKKYINLQTSDHPQLEDPPKTKSILNLLETQNEPKYTSKTSRIYLKNSIENRKSLPTNRYPNPTDIVQPSQTPAYFPCSYLNSKIHSDIVKFTKNSKFKLEPTPIAVDPGQVSLPVLSNKALCHITPSPIPEDHKTPYSKVLMGSSAMFLS